MTTNKMRLLIVIFCIVHYVCATRVSYRNYKVYEVKPQNVKQFEVLKNIEDFEDVDFWTDLREIGMSSNVMVSPKFQDELEELFQRNLIEHKILIHDVERTISSDLVYLEKYSDEISFKKYHRYDEIQQYLLDTAAKYPELVSFENYGRSYENRTLSLIKISTDPTKNKPLIFVDAGIHAREWIAPAQALYIIHRLLEHPENRNLFENVDWLVIPLLNPDGYEYTHEVDRFWRKTRSKGQECDGVDPNRNFDFHWRGPGTSDDECSNTYAGPKPFSEPETLALSQVVQRHAKRTKLYMTLHSAAQCLLYPWGYTSDLPENADELHGLAEAAEKAISSVNGTRYSIGSSVNTLAPASGSSRDWAKGVANIGLSYTVELPPGGSNGFDLPPDRILDVVREIFEGIKVFHAYVEQNFG